MALTPQKQALLERLNESAKQQHAELSEKAARAGRQPPPAPVPLAESQIEFPKWLHKGWGQTSKTHSLHLPSESALAKTPEEMKDLLAQGYSEEAPPPVKKDGKKE